MVHPSLLRGNYPTRVSFFSLSSSRFNTGRHYSRLERKGTTEREREKGRHPSSLRRGPSHPAARFARINTRHPNRSPSHPLFACAACLPACPPACQNLPSKSLWRIRTASSQIRQHPETLSKSSATITPPIVPRVTLRGRRYRRIHDRSYRDRRFRAVGRGRKEIEGAWWLLCSAVEEQVRAFAVRRRVEIFWRSAWNFHARIGKSYND